MSKQIPPATPEINRLRAAAALIPIIESGLANSKFSVERAALMASFCEWAIEKVPADPEVVKLAETVGKGLKRIKRGLAPVAWKLSVTGYDKVWIPLMEQREEHLQGDDVGRLKAFSRR